MIYIGLVSYNSKNDLVTCIPSILKQTHTQIRITVYDNASTDDTVSWIKKTYPNIQVIKGKENIGFGRAHNAIINSCKLKKNDWYLCLNPDVILDKDYIQCILTASSAKKFDWGTGALLFQNKKNIYSVGHALVKSGYNINIGYGLKISNQLLTSREVFGASGAAAMYSYKLIRTLSTNGHFFDPAMFMYSEDIDIDWRAQLSGFHCWFVGNAHAYHRGGKPTPLLRAHTIVNRYISVMKNAFLIDLFFYNIPIIMMHLCFRLIVTPKLGTWMIIHFLKNFLHAFQSRTKPAISRQQMHTWFTWSNKQRGMLASTIVRRTKKFFSE